MKTKNEQLPTKKQDSRLAVLRNTVAQGATDVEFQMFLEYCKATKLNPYKREIWFIKFGGKVQIMTGFAGYLTIANSHPQYDGMESGITRDEKGLLVSAWCKVYRKDRKFPSHCEVMFNEFAKGGNWDKMPTVMILKVAKSHALREAFPQELGGMYVPEEMPAEAEAPKLSFEQVAQLEAAPKHEFSEEELESILADEAAAATSEVIA